MHKIWFGTAERFTQVKCPAFNANTSAEGWNASGTFLNGGAWVKSSPTAHMVYDFEWNLDSQDDIREIVDYATGVYGSGPVYFYLPGVMETNVLPEYVAAPSMGPASGVLLREDATMTEVLPPAAFRATHDLPVRGLRLQGEGGGSVKWRPTLIPPGYTARLDVWGKRVSGTGLRFGSTEVDIPATDGIATLTLSATTSVVSAPLTFVSGDITIYGMKIRIVPTSEASSLNAGKWVPGRGHWGCRFESRPTLSTYSSALDLYGARARLVETGAWE